MERKPMKKKILPKAVEEEKKTTLDCPICCIEYSPDSDFHCHSCNIHHCIGCFKKYLLDTTQDPHCMNCRTVITYDQFMKFTDKTWRFKTYKKQREAVLMEREQSKFPATVGHLANLREASIIQQEVNVLIQKRNELNTEIERLQFNIARLKGIAGTAVSEEKKERIVYQWVQACPSKDCRGFLNQDFECPVCNVSFCKDCLVPHSEGHASPEGAGASQQSRHECDAELVETLKEIKKDAKPCPTCGEFISKISGCDQMFCTGCGTAFSWKTGQKESGLIHNPHAFEFFQRNPEQRELYDQQRRRNQAGEGGACRQYVPHYTQIRMIPLCQSWQTKISHFQSNVWNLHEYQIPRIEEYVVDQDMNLDIRIKYIQKEYSEKDFKRILHQREKKRNFVRMILPILRNTYDIFANYLWAMVDSTDPEKIKQMVEHINELRGETNDIFMKISEDLGYSATVMIGVELAFDGLHVRLR